jgi:hypothetical protein
VPEGCGGRLGRHISQPTTCAAVDAAANRRVLRCPGRAPGICREMSNIFISAASSRSEPRRDPSGSPGIGEVRRQRSFTGLPSPVQLLRMLSSAPRMRRCAR